MTTSIAGVVQEPDLAWLQRFSVPFDAAGSKNAAHNRGPSQPARKVYLQKHHKAYRDAVALKAKSVLTGITIKQNKIWIDIFVQMPNHRGDAINYVDMVCDALKAVIGIDDKWFCLRHLDWEICKTDPKIFIGVGQEDVEDVLCCQTCGLLKTFDEFPRNAGSKNGKYSRCKDCLRVGPPPTW